MTFFCVRWKMMVRYTPIVKQHSLEKIRLHNYYASIFTTSMKQQWPQLAYLGLVSGAGRATVEETNEIVETTAISAVRRADPCTKYIFIDNDKRCIRALQTRIDTLQTEPDVTLIPEDVNAALPKIIAAMPTVRPGQGLLSFCFVDPFSAEFDFKIIRTLGSKFRMDFLILLMLGRDIRTNFKRYYEDPNDTRIAALIDDPDWRAKWAREERPQRYLIRFLLESFDAAMTTLGYHTARPADAHSVRISGKGVFLYSLVFYSKHKLGRQFWKTTRSGTTLQTSLDL